MSSSPDNNNASTFPYGNNSFIKTEMPFIKNDLHYIKTEMPYIGHRNMFTDQTGMHLLKPSSKKKNYLKNNSKSNLLNLFFVR